MSGVKPRVWRRTKAVLAYLCVPILVSALILFVLSSLQFAIKQAPENWNLHTPFIFYMMAWGTWICVPVAWFVGPIVFMDRESGGDHLLWRQIGLGGGVGGFFDIFFAGIAFSSGALLFGSALFVLGAVLGAIHALGLRCALLWLGLIGPTRDIDAGAAGTAASIHSEW